MAEPRMPEEIIQYMDENDWGNHHVIWHYSRLWDVSNSQIREWLTQRGGGRAPVQEGAPGNGLEFLTMHHSMIVELSKAFPGSQHLFEGWDHVPTELDDVNDPVPAGPFRIPFDPHKAAAITHLEDHLGDFATEDDLGLFIETELRPVAQDPQRRSPDLQVGIHNYLHARFNDFGSDIRMGYPEVNIKNQRFWRLHGFIDNLWRRYRQIKHIPEPADVRLHMHPPSHGMTYSHIAPHNRVPPPEKDIRELERFLVPR